MKPPNRPDRDRHVPASTINPDAGDYPITADPAERAASTTATRRTWEAFPYYHRRYGERGWRFSLSDSGWIATLCSLPPMAVPAKVQWLQRLLATRGMPSYLLERHLVALAEEFGTRIPGEAARYAVLAMGARMLLDERLRVVDALSFDSAAQAFDDEVRSMPDAVPAMGAVLASAIVDGVLGVAPEKFTFDWALDEARFVPEWRATVQRFRTEFRAKLTRPTTN